MAKSIEVIIGTAGDIKIDAVGFKGSGCEKATEFLEKELGTIHGKTRKPEYHARCVNASRQEVGR
jgi:hypothetical protein